MLKSTYTELLARYSDNNVLITELWAEIERNYSGPGRYYHTLTHLDNLFRQLTAVEFEMKNRDILLFTLYYHDAVYDVQQADNEEQSALLAEKRMNQLLIPETLIIACKAQILATRTHLKSTDTDTNLFTDADLSILGQDWDTYLEYCKNIRKEYAIYPDVAYVPGRKKVLEHFLEMGCIYKTAYFHSRFEQQAKQNLQREWETL